jgi:hypothetical protein
MPRDGFGDQRDDYADDPRPPRSQSSNSGLIIGLLVGGGLLVVLVCGGTLAYLFMAHAPARQQPAATVRAEAIPAEHAPDPAALGPARANRRVMSKVDFESAVRGKTRDEITAAVGQPNLTRKQVPEKAKVARPGGQDTGEQITFYYDWSEFHNRVINPDTGKPYPVVKVRFDGGKADRIEYP